MHPIPTRFPFWAKYLQGPYGLIKPGRFFAKTNNNLAQKNKR